MAGQPPASQDAEEGPGMKRHESAWHAALAGRVGANALAARPRRCSGWHVEHGGVPFEVIAHGCVRLALLGPDGVAAEELGELVAVGAKIAKPPPNSRRSCSPAARD
jgi:hypothetical protein